MFAAVNLKHGEENCCYSVQFKITEKELGEENNVSWFFDGEEIWRCSSYASSDKTFGQPTEPNEKYNVATADGAEGIGLKKFTTRVETAIKIRSHEMFDRCSQVQWLPRVRRVTIKSIFTIESKIIPELKDFNKSRERPELFNG